MPFEGAGKKVRKHANQMPSKSPKYLDCFHFSASAKPNTDTRMIRIFKIFILIVACNMAQVRAAGNTDANRLYEDLMMSYNRFARPVQNDTETLVIKLGLKLSQLIDVVSVHV